MNVNSLLARLDQTIRSVMEQMDRNGHGLALVVDGDRRLLDAITDGDIRRAILAGTDLGLPVSTLRDRSRLGGRDGPVTAPAGTGTGELLRLMEELSIRHVPLVDGEGRVQDVAVLSELIKEQELPLTAIVMAGGYGTRLRPLTDDVPKPMLPVGDRPLLERIVEQLRASGIRRVNVATHFRKEMISNHFGDGRGFGVDIRYVEEDEPLGTAGALSLLEPSDDPMLVINGDILTRLDFRAMLDFHREHAAEMTVAIKQHEFQVPFGVIETDGPLITRIDEKPVITRFINAGIYLLSPDACRSVPSGRPYDMPDLIAALIADGRRVVGFPVTEYWLDVGQEADYRQAQDEARRGDG